MHARRRLSLLEVVVVSGILGVMTVALVSFEVSSFGAYGDQQVYGSVSTMGRRAMITITREIRHSLSTDPAVQALGAVQDTTWPDVGYGFAFRRVIGGGASGSTYGEPVAFVGPNSTVPNPPISQIQGICRMRHSNLLVGSSYVFTPGQLNSQRGPDNLFGTTDDRGVPGTGGDIQLQALVPSIYAPAPAGVWPTGVPASNAGPMFQVTYNQPERTVLVEMRLNLRQGSRYLLRENLVLRETICLLN